LGVDPFETSEDIQLPVTISEFVKVYENGAHRSDLMTVYCARLTMRADGSHNGISSVLGGAAGAAGATGAAGGG
jgi:hypothetical protein